MKFLKKNQTIIFLSLLLLLALTSCTNEAERTRMRSGLDSLNVRNRTDQPFTPADVQPYADYFDRHGTANDRLLAHYLMGRAYHEQGESPMALQCYQQAAECADTTDKDCDFAQLSRVYSQTAWVYHQQLLFSYETESRQKACRFAELSGNTRISAYEMELMAGTYILQNKHDSAESTITKVLSSLKRDGFNQDYNRASLILMFLYCDRHDKLQELGSLVHTYDSTSNQFDNHHELHNDNRIFYYYKGRFHEKSNRLDSATYYYRKIYYPGMSYTMYNSMYKGLLSVYAKLNMPDSISKYSQLYCEVNDSSIAIKDQSLTAKLRASYNYGIHVLEAKNNERKFYQMFIAFLFVVILCIVIILLLLYMRNRYRQHQEAKQKELNSLKDEYAELTSRYDRNSHIMSVLEETHKATVAKLNSAERTLAESKAEYVRNIDSLKSENDELMKKINQLKRNDSISDLIAKAHKFIETPPVKLIRQEAENIKPKVTQQTWQELISVCSQFYPGLINDLDRYDNIGRQEMYAAILVALNIRTDSIALVLKVSSQRITNIKAILNETLFGVRSARPLYENMKKRYGLFLTDG